MTTTAATDRGKSGRVHRGRNSDGSTLASSKQRERSGRDLRVGREGSTRAQRAAWLRRARSFLRNADPVLARLIDDRPDFDFDQARADNPFGLALPTDLFGALLFQITGQQLSIPATRRNLARVAELFGGHLPSPKELMGVDSAEVRKSGLSWRKVRTLRDLAGRLSDKRLDPKLLNSLPDDEIVAELTAIPGIGPWTVHGALLLLGREDVAVPGDLRVRKAVKAAYRLDHLPSQQGGARHRGQVAPLPQPGDQLPVHSHFPAGKDTAGGSAPDLTTRQFGIAGSLVARHSAGRI